MNIFDQSKAAISALQSLADTTEIKRAEHWLIDFERTSDAWEVSNLLLSEPLDSPHLFWGAKILYTKIKRDFHQLESNPGYITQLPSIIVQHLTRLALSSQSKEIKVTCRYLCLSLAALVVQLNQDGSIGQLLQLINPILESNSEVVLELINYLPEECFNKQIDVVTSVRESFSQKLSQSCSDIFSFLSFIYSNSNINEENGLNIACRSLKCFDAWINFTEIPVEVIMSLTIYQQALECIRLPEYKADLFERAVEVIISVIVKFGAENLNLLSLTFPSILSLRPLLLSQIANLDENCDDEDTSCCRSICRLYAITAESCIDIFNKSSALAQTEILTTLLECAKFPYNHYISRIPLKFFYVFACKLINDDESSTVDPILLQYAPMYKLVLDCALTHISMPEESITGTDSVDDVKMEQREDWLETVKDCISVLKWEECLNHVCMELQKQLSCESIKWGSVEACLSCLDVIAKVIKKNDTNPSLPQLMILISSLPELPGLKTTAISLIGSFSNWLSVNNSYLNPLLQQLFTSLKVKFTCFPASNAIKRIFYSCSKTNLPIQELHSLLLSMRKSNTIPIDAETNILEGFCFVIMDMNKSDDQLNALKFIVEPIVAQFASELATVGISQQLLKLSITRINTIMKTIQIDPELITSIFIQIVPLLQNCLINYSSDEDFAEEICKCYKYSIRNCGDTFIPYLEQMLIHIVDCFTKTHFSAYIYVANTILKNYGDIKYNNAYDQILYQVVWSISSAFFAKFTSLDNFTKNPDVVEEYFYLMNKSLKYFPRQLIISTESYSAIGVTLLQAGIVGLKLEHKLAQKEILYFFESLIRVNDNFPNSDLSLATMTLIHEGGPSLVEYLIRCLSNQIPSWAIDENNGVMTNVLSRLHILFPVDFQQWVLAGIYTLPNWAQEEAKKSNLHNLQCSPPAQIAETKEQIREQIRVMKPYLDDLKNKFEHFSGKCKRDSTTVDY